VPYMVQNYFLRILQTLFLLFINIMLIFASNKYQSDEYDENSKTIIYLSSSFDRFGEVVCGLQRNDIYIKDNTFKRYISGCYLSKE